MRILLTGGSGFIGQNILESTLAEKYELLSPCHCDLELTDEVAVRRYIEEHQIESIIHTAAKPGHRNAIDPTGIFYTNTRIFFNIARNHDLFQKMIVVGSGAIYDMRYYQPKMPETYFGQHVPIDEHGFAKYVMGQYIESNSKIIDLRVFGIYGKYEDYAIRFISNLLCKALLDLPLTMYQNRKFDYIHVADLMPVLDFFLTHETKFQSYNVTSDVSVALYDLALTIKRLTGTSQEILVAREGMGIEYSGDNHRLRNEMSELEYTSIDNGIKMLYKWYADHKDEINKECLTVLKY